MPVILNTTYPLDPTGLSLANLIENEQQTLTAKNGINYHLIIPTNGPFFEKSLIISITNPITNAISILTVGIDYYPTHLFISASRACADSIYGSITILDNTLSGILTLSYQTLGGDWLIDSATKATILGDILHNPRVTAWEEVTDYPTVFPPTPHQWDLVDMVGMTDVVSALNGITDTIMLQTAATEVAVNLIAAAPLTSYSPTVGNVLVGDSVLQAIEKIDGNILAETDRALSAESAIQLQIDAIENSGDSLQSLSNAIATEAIRAIDAEALLVSKSITINTHPLSNNVVLTKSDIGLSNVDNTSDLNKPVSNLVTNAITALQTTASNDATTKANAAQAAATAASTPLSHMGSSGLAHGIVTTSENGFMSSSDKVKLDGITAGAGGTVVTGVSSISAVNPITSTGGTNPSISILPATTSSAGSMSAIDKTKLDGIAVGANVSPIATVAGRTGNVVLTKSDVGLSSVDNTTDLNKPVSTAVTVAITNEATRAILAETNIAAVANSAYSSLGTTLNNVISTVYTLVLSDGTYQNHSGNTILMNNTSDQLITVPANSSVNYPVGTTIQVIQIGTGKVTFTPDVGVTLNSVLNYLSIGVQFGAVSLLQISTNVWVIVGSLDN